MTEPKRCILLKYGELILKGDNRNYFETVLLRQIKNRLGKLGTFSVTSAQSTIFVETEDDFLLDEAKDILKKVFGIVSLSVAWKTEKDMDAILSVVREKIVPTLSSTRTFKADAKRSDKKFPLKSPEISALVGGAVLEEVNGAVRVDVRNPEIVVWTEIRDDGAYLHAGKEKGAGGIPYGTSDRLLLLLSGGIDSPVAGYRMARRGARIDALHFESFPYTSERAKEKVVDLAAKLACYTDKINLGIVSVTKIQLALKDVCREEYFTLLLRRSMMRIANRVALHQGCRGIVTGESLGQVASQTVDALITTEQASDLPVFRPLIGMDKEEIIETSRQIDCFETSILPYEDCCTVFTPRHPKLHPELEKVLEEEKKLDLASLEEEAIREIEFRKVEWQ